MFYKLDLIRIIALDLLATMIPFESFFLSRRSKVFIHPVWIMEMKQSIYPIATINIVTRTVRFKIFDVVKMYWFSRSWTGSGMSSFLIKVVDFRVSSCSRFQGLYDSLLGLCEKNFYILSNFFSRKADEWTWTKWELWFWKMILLVKLLENLLFGKNFLVWCLETVI